MKFLSLKYAALVIILLALSLAALWSKYNKAIAEIDREVANRKAYELELSGERNTRIALALTVDQLNYSKDSLNSRIVEILKSKGTKVKTVSEVSYVNIETVKVDSVYITELERCAVDTTLGDEWVSTRVVIDSGGLRVASRTKNELLVNQVDVRETVNPPRKFFIARWFQRRHTVVYTDVILMNPYSETKSKRFIKIIK